TRQLEETTETLYAVSFSDSSHGTVVGYGGIILRTTNGGQTWAPQYSGTFSKLRGVWFTDTNTGTVVGDDGVILHTTNGGQTWTRQSWISPALFGNPDYLYGVCFTDANTG